MDIQTGESHADTIRKGTRNGEGFLPQNYAVAVVQRQVFARSNITASFINRESFDLNYETHDSSYCGL
jgi:hypothetical protein